MPGPTRWSTRRLTRNDLGRECPGRRSSVSSGLEEARRLVQHRGEHPVISLYLDLDPERFATAPARASQIRSLLDEAGREVERLDGRGHEDRLSRRADLRRCGSFL